MEEEDFFFKVFVNKLVAVVFNFGYDLYRAKFSMSFIVNVFLFLFSVVIVFFVFSLGEFFDVESFRILELLFSFCVYTVFKVLEIL